MGQITCHPNDLNVHTLWLHRKTLLGKLPQWERDPSMLRLVRGACLIGPTVQLAGTPLERGMGLSIASYISASSAALGREADASPMSCKTRLRCPLTCPLMPTQARPPTITLRPAVGVSAARTCQLPSHACILHSLEVRDTDR